MNIRTDADLVEGARKGEVEDFGELYRRHYSAVVGVAYGAVADRHIAEDAAQEAFVVAARDLHRLRRSGRFGPWVCTIAKRTAAKMARSRREKGVLGDTPAPSTADSPPDPGEIVRKAVTKLPERSREVVVLHYFTGLSHKEIAASLGLSPEAVHGRLVRARRMLADRLENNGFGGVAR